MGRALKITGLIVLATVFVLSAGSSIYYWSLTNSPEYSLALLVHDVQNGDYGAVDDAVNVDAVVENFIPQVQEKAVELYGKGLPPTVLDVVAKAAAPLIPALTKRARAEIPVYVREKTARFKGYPVALMAIGIGRRARVDVDGDVAIVRVPVENRNVELTMSRSSGRWRIIAVRDDVLARQVAEKLGQELIVAAIKGGVGEVAEKLGIGGLEDLLNGLDDVVK